MAFDDAVYTINEVSKKIDERLLSVVVPNDTDIIHTFITTSTAPGVLATFRAVIDGTVRLYETGKNYNSNSTGSIVLSTSEEGFAVRHKIIENLSNNLTTKNVDIAIRRGVVYKLELIRNEGSNNPTVTSLDIRGAIVTVDPSQIVAV